MEHVIPSYLGNALLRICEKTSTPRSLTVAILLRYREWDQLVMLDCDPVNYRDADHYYGDVVVTDFLRKAENLPTSFDRTKVAEDNFWKSERGCYSTNERLSPYVFGSLEDPREERILAFFGRVRQKATQILGASPPDELMGRFGPGATFGDKGQYCTVPDKMSSDPTLTSDALPFLFQWSGTAWASACASSGKGPVFIRGNRFTTVPKDCRKNRGIAVEPSINVFYQLALGRSIRGRLRAQGLDLDYAQDVHRQVARESSITGRLCTLDLSNASDTVSTNLVKLVLPPRWFEILADLRSPYTLVRGRWVKLEKFSSMGNGYTFELETLIFLCVIATVMDDLGHKPIIHDNLFVFGDDLIFPTELAHEVKCALRYCGLTVNETKSFVSGPFRESCGGDFFNGVDVRPFHLKEIPSEPQQIIALANGVRRLGRKNPGSAPLDPRFHSAWFSILDALPSALRRLRGPEDLGDLVIHDDESRWQTRWRHSIRYIGVYRPARFRKVPWQVFKPDVILACAVYGLGHGGRLKEKSEVDDGGVIPRDAVSGYKIGWTPRS